ncbi:hypothetical protein [Collimonas humicola]|uniref:hypothetical protein n=1 Tax=Collimonas humicola TaxID=2825886 RepID=UPI001B8AA60E|nr:hypothetical protein [Collimonas humicola]
MNWNAVCALPNQKKNGKNAGIYSKLSMIDGEPGCWGNQAAGKVFSRLFAKKEAGQQRKNRISRNSANDFHSCLRSSNCTHID